MEIIDMVFTRVQKLIWGVGPHTLPLESTQEVLCMQTGAHNDVRVEGKEGACNDHAKD